MEARNHGIRESWNQELKESGSEEFRDSWNHGIKDQGPGIKGFKECQRRISSIHSIGPKVEKIDLDWLRLYVVTIRFFLYMGQELDDTTNTKNQVLRHLENHNNIVTPPANMEWIIAVIWTRKTSIKRMLYLTLMKERKPRPSLQHKFSTNLLTLHKLTQSAY